MLCGQTRPVKPRAHGPDRDIECTGDLVVAEVGQRVEEQRVPLPRRHSSECSGQLSAVRRVAYSCRRVVLIGDPVVDSATSVGVQLTALDPPVAMEQVRCDPIQPWQDAVACATARAPLEGKRERFCGQLVSEITTSSSMEVPVDGTEVAIEDQRERCRLT